MNVDRFLYQIKQNLPEHEGVTVWIDESAVRLDMATQEALKSDIPEVFAIT